MARSRRTLDRKSLREQNEAAERSKKKKDDEEVDEAEDEEDEDEDEDEDEEEEDEDGESSDSGDDDEGGDDDEDDEERPKPKKKKAAPKPKAPRVSRARTPKIVRMRVVWGVFNNSHQMIEEFDYPKKNAAMDMVAKLTADKKSGHPFFLQPVKKPMEKEEKKEKEK